MHCQLTQSTMMQSILKKMYSCFIAICNDCYCNKVKFGNCCFICTHYTQVYIQKVNCQVKLNENHLFIVIDLNQNSFDIVSSVIFIVCVCICLPIQSVTHSHSYSRSLPTFSNTLPCALCIIREEKFIETIHK